MLDNTTLTLFFTRRVGLHHWNSVGNLDREVEIYRQLTHHLSQVNFVTYGGQQDKPFVDHLTPIHLHATPGRLPVFASQFILQSRNHQLLQETDVFKTNQIPGAETALWAKRKYGKKLITRCGYLYSRFMDEHTTNRLRIRRAYNLEQRAFAEANAGVVTSHRDREWTIKTHQLDPEKMHVIPNYVVTDVFKPLPDVAKTYDLVCISKASPQKNLGALFEALGQLKKRGQSKSLLLIGLAAQDQTLRDQAEALDLEITWVPRVANFELPNYLNQARVFILPSLYEGHPKALLEAMSCGLACIGTDVPGVREDVQHEMTGYLCQPEAVSLIDAIESLLADDTLQHRLGAQAREYILTHYSIDAILQQELSLIDRVLGQ